MKRSQLLIALAILIAGSFIMMGLFKTAPEAEKVALEEVFPVVRVMTAEKTSPALMITTQGEVTPPKRTMLSTQVTGKIISVSHKYAPGAQFTKDEVILEIENLDYQTALINAQATMAQAEASVKEAEVGVELENARVVQSLRDWEKLGKGREASDLLLRKPQIAAAQAALASCKANLERAHANIDQAQRNLDRTKIRAPYDCQIEQKQMDLGALVTIGSPLLSIYEIGQVEIRLPISLEDLPYVSLDEGTPPVKAYGKYGNITKEWTGKIVRNENRIDPQSRTAYVVAAFEDDDLPPVGMFTTVELQGSELENVFAVPRIALFGDNQVGIISPDDTLTFRSVTVSRSSDKTVYLSSGVEEGERICLTILNTPIEGMQVKVTQ